MGEALLTKGSAGSSSGGSLNPLDGAILVGSKSYNLSSTEYSTIPCIISEEMFLSFTKFIICIYVDIGSSGNYSAYVGDDSGGLQLAYLCSSKAPFTMYCHYVDFIKDDSSNTCRRVSAGSSYGNFSFFRSGNFCIAFLLPDKARFKGTVTVYVK